MSDIRKKYKKYWISVANLENEDNSCASCDAKSGDCISICVLERCSKEVNNKLPIFKLIKKA